MKRTLIQLLLIVIAGIKLTQHVTEITYPVNHNLPSVSPFVGEWIWEKNNESKDFSVDIKKSGGYLVGDYCCVMQNGDKIDCSDDKNNIAFKVPIPNGNSFSFMFKSSFSETTGEAKITFDGKNIIWEIIKEPSGEYYCPKNAKLIKKKK